MDDSQKQEIVGVLMREHTSLAMKLNRDQTRQEEKVRNLVGAQSFQFSAIDIVHISILTTVYGLSQKKFTRLVGLADIQNQNVDVFVKGHLRCENCVW